MVTWLKRSMLSSSRHSWSANCTIQLVSCMISEMVSLCAQASRRSSRLGKSRGNGSGANCNDELPATCTSIVSVTLRDSGC